jgi:RNA polymerase sigma factor (sigma-70 family)
VIERSLQDPRAFGEIFHRHAPRVHRYVARRAGEAAADDVTSETFLIAFERRGRFDLSRDDAQPWLFGIATNLIHRHRVAEARMFRSIERATAEPLLADIAVRLDEAVDAQLAVKALAHALRKLPIRERDCLLLFAWADLTYEQIAMALDIPIGTVRSRLNRARRALSTTPINEEGHNERVQHAPDPA